MFRRRRELWVAIKRDLALDTDIMVSASARHLQNPVTAVEESISRSYIAQFLRLMRIALAVDPLGDVFRTMCECGRLRRRDRGRMVTDAKYFEQPGLRIIHIFAQNRKATGLVQGLSQKMRHPQRHRDPMLFE